MFKFLLYYSEWFFLGNYDFIKKACKYNKTKKIEWLIQSGYEFEKLYSLKHSRYDFYIHWTITYAAHYGNVQVLNWVKHSGYKLKYNGGCICDKTAIDNAAKYGHVQVLEWFKRSGCEFKYDELATCAAINGRVQVLEWFKHSGYKFKYNVWSIYKAKNMIILKWFIENITPKKVIIWSKLESINVLRFKTKKRYFKGYKKN